MNDNFANDSLLWDSFLSGDEEAYTYIYKENVQKLFRYGLQFTSDKELIKDCIQDVFVKIYSHRSRIGTTDNIAYYLLGSMKNTLINMLSKNRNKSLHIDSLEDMTDIEDTAEYHLINKEEESLVNMKVDQLMSQLTDRQREIIHYRFIENMSVRQIGEITDMNNQSVSNIIQRSLKKVKESLKKNQKK